MGDTRAVDDLGALQRWRTNANLPINANPLTNTHLPINANPLTNAHLPINVNLPTTQNL
jgi:hypothetical protein